MFRWRFVDAVDVKPLGSGQHKSPHLANHGSLGAAIAQQMFDIVHWTARVLVGSSSRFIAKMFKRLVLPSRQEGSPLHSLM